MKKLAIFGLVMNLFLFNAVGHTDWFDPSAVANSAQTAAIGGIEGFNNSAAVILENPAAMKTLKTYSFSTFKTSVMNEFNYSNFLFTANTSLGRFGFGIVKCGVDGIPQTKVDQFNEFILDKNVQYSNDLYLFSHLLPQKNFMFGYTLKYYKAVLGDVTGVAINADVGILTRFIGSDLSFVAKNIFIPFQYHFSNNQSEKLPLQFVLSGKTKISKEIYIFEQLKMVRKTNSGALKALGVTYNPEFFKQISFSGGWKEFYVQEAIRSNISYGLGLNLNDTLSFNYASETTDYIEGNSNNYFSMAVSF